MIRIIVLLFGLRFGQLALVISRMRFGQIDSPEPFEARPDLLANQECPHFL
jgi:hypothetical protein